MKALVVYESMYGNTHVVADRIAEGLRTRVETDVVSVGDATADMTRAELGASAAPPTRQWRPMCSTSSRRRSRRVRVVRLPSNAARRSSLGGPMDAGRRRALVSTAVSACAIVWKSSIGIADAIAAYAAASAPAPPAPANALARAPSTPGRPPPRPRQPPCTAR